MERQQEGHELLDRSSVKLRTGVRAVEGSQPILRGQVLFLGQVLARRM